MLSDLDVLYNCSLYEDVINDDDGQKGKLYSTGAGKAAGDSDGALELSEVAGLLREELEGGRITNKKCLPIERVDEEALFRHRTQTHACRTGQGCVSVVWETAIVNLVYDVWRRYSETDHCQRRSRVPIEPASARVFCDMRPHDQPGSGQKKARIEEEDSEAEAGGDSDCEELHQLFVWEAGRYVRMEREEGEDTRIERVDEQVVFRGKVCQSCGPERVVWKRSVAMLVSSLYRYDDPDYSLEGLVYYEPTRVEREEVTIWESGVYLQEELEEGYDVLDGPIEEEAVFRQGSAVAVWETAIPKLVTSVQKYEVDEVDSPGEGHVYYKVQQQQKME